MKNLSKNEWIAVSAGIIFVGYTLFGGSIMSLFQKNIMNPNSSVAATAGSNVSNNNGVAINDVVVGNGAEVKTGDLVSVNYILSLSDGTVVQDSKVVRNGEPFQFTLGAGQVIPGWEMGFTGMRVGGVRTITIPPELAYGPNQTGPIPPNSTLVFRIELLDVSTPPAPQPLQ
jgi:FKBP-type peptidyl-prolyl cis-trans isomerase